MSLTVVIPVRDDPAVVDCVRSIEGAVQALLVFNGSTRRFAGETLDRLAGCPVISLQRPEPHLSRALQHGIDASPTERVLLMDSDCRFRPGAVAAMAQAFEAGEEEGAVFKGSVRFDPGTRLASRVIARTRQQHTASRLCAYKPPLGVSRKLAPRIGGYFFDSRLRWKEDADLDHRVRKAGVAVLPVPGCVIDHAPLGVRQDLRSAFRYGVGAATARRLGIEVSAPNRSVREALRRDGMATAAYLALANGVRTLGYVSAQRLPVERGAAP